MPCSIVIAKHQPTTILGQAGGCYSSLGDPRVQAITSFVPSAQHRRLIYLLGGGLYTLKAQMSLIPCNPESAEHEAAPSVATLEHCFHAFDALYCALTGSQPIPPKFVDEKYPLFVTWNIRSSRPNRPTRLRGCIGTFEPQPIQEGLAEYALISAFKDSRFDRIQERELPYLECAISLLTNFEDASSYLDWTIGVHGIYISFPHPSISGVLTSSSPSSGASTPSAFSPPPTLFSSRFTSKRPMTATYLPDVMPEQGWSKIEAVDSAIRKAGWDGHITEDLRRSIKLRRYQSSKCSADWDEYVAWREHNGSDVNV